MFDINDNISRYLRITSNNIAISSGSKLDGITRNESIIQKQVSTICGDRSNIDYYDNSKTVYYDIIVL